MKKNISKTYIFSITTVRLKFWVDKEKGLLP
jgi:hypothetical protein